MAKNKKTMFQGGYETMEAKIRSGKARFVPAPTTKSEILRRMFNAPFCIILILSVIGAGLAWYDPQSYGWLKWFYWIFPPVAVLRRYIDVTTPQYVEDDD